MARRNLLAAAILAASVVRAGSARAWDLGGQIGMGAGLSVGETRRRVHSQETSESGGGGIGLDLGASAWLGHLVVAGNGAVVTTLTGPSEVIATAGLGARLRLGPRWRMTALAEAGRHTFSGLGAGLLAQSRAVSPTLPCWGARLTFDRKRPPPSPVSVAWALFLVVDRGTADVDVEVSSSLLGGSSDQRHRAGGVQAGVMARLLFGS